MKLYKSQRHTAYILMLVEFRNHFPSMGEGSWFCYLIWDLFRIENSGFCKNDDYDSIYSVMRHFQELNDLFYKDRPAHRDYEAREIILKKCIEETADF